MWSGEPETNEVLKEIYGVDEVVYDEQLEGLLERLESEAQDQENGAGTRAVELELHTIEYGFDATKQGLPPKFRSRLQKGKIDRTLFETRLIKSPDEIALIREANRLSAQAHIKLMRAAKRQTHTTEHELYALFLYETTRKGAFHQACESVYPSPFFFGARRKLINFLPFRQLPSRISYLRLALLAPSAPLARSDHPICASGCHASALHYIKNRGPFPPDPRNLVLIDAGCEYFCYASDITRTWPVGGRYAE